MRVALKDSSIRLAFLEQAYYICTLDFQENVALYESIA